MEAPRREPGLCFGRRRSGWSGHPTARRGDVAAVSGPGPVLPINPVHLTRFGQALYDGMSTRKTPRQHPSMPPNRAQMVTDTSSDTSLLLWVQTPFLVKNI